MSENSVTAKEIETALITAYKIDKKTRKITNRQKQDFCTILNLVLGVLQEKLQVEFCPDCGKILPHEKENCLNK